MNIAAPAKLPAIAEIWVYLSGSPLFALIVTLSAYQVGLMLSARTKGNPLANPVAVAIAIVAAVISIGQVSYEDYFAGAQFIHFLLGTATVSLAVPIYRGVASPKGRALPLLVALFYGGGTSILTAVGLARLLGGDAQIVHAMYAKSVTAPIGMGIAERIGASPTLTAVFAVTTGILGSILAPFVLNALRIVPGWRPTAWAPAAPSRWPRRTACSPGSPWACTASSAPCSSLCWRGSRGIIALRSNPCPQVYN